MIAGSTRLFIFAQMVAGPKATVSNASVSGKDVQIGTVKGLPGDGNAITEGVALSTGSLIDPDPTADSDTDAHRSPVGCRGSASPGFRRHR